MCITKEEEEAYLTAIKNEAIQKTIYAHSYTQIPVDRNVKQVQDMLNTRMERGYKKYGTNTERTDLTLRDWLQHLQEELCDAAIYIQKVKNSL